MSSNVRRRAINASLCFTAVCISTLIGLAPVKAAETEEIIVTARKRQESILNVPVVEIALPREQLEKFQVTQMTDLPKVVPGLQIGHSLLSIGAQVSIRGVGSISQDPGVDSSVALNIDGLSLGNGLVFQSGTFDLGQIEALKGPQALFYGKASPAGVISLRTADPTDKFEVIARAAYEFESINPRGELIVSGPVNDTLKLRLATMYSHMSGYFYNKAVPATAFGGAAPPHSREPRSENIVIRGTALWNPSPNFDARLKLNFVKDRALDAETAQLASCPDGAGSAPFGIPFMGGDNCVMDRELRIVSMNPAAFPSIMNNGNPYIQTYQRFGTLELNYRPIDKITATSTTALYFLRSTSMVNATHATAAAPAIVAENHFFRHELNEEVRVNSDFDTPWNFTVGGFYQDGKMSDNVTILGNTFIRLPALLANGLSVLDIKTYSAFGQLRWKIMPRLELAGGGRWTDETRRETETNLITGAPIPTPITRIHSSRFSPEATLTYRPTDDMTLFAAYKQATKSGSFSISTPPQPNADNSFGDEKVKGYEVGLKSRFLDRTLSVNASWYDYRYYGLQVGAIDPPKNGLPVIHTVNAGEARTYGIDFDISYRPPSIQGLQLNGSANWNHGRYITLTNVPCWGGQMISEGCTRVLNPATGLFTAQNLSGTPMVRAPSWQMNLGFDYEMPVGHDYTVTVSSSAMYSSKYVQFLAIDRPNNDNYQRAYAKVDLGITLRSPNDRWEIAVIGKNINDKIIAGACSAANFAGSSVLGGEITGGTTRGRAGIDEVGCYSDPGREVWLRLTFKPFE